MKLWALHHMTKDYLTRQAEVNGELLALRNYRKVLAERLRTQKNPNTAPITAGASNLARLLVCEEVIIDIETGKKQEYKKFLFKQYEGNNSPGKNIAKLESSEYPPFAWIAHGKNQRITLDKVTRIKFVELERESRQEEYFGRFSQNLRKGRVLVQI